MLKSTASSIRTRSPLKVFMVFALGIILPGGFLSYLGLRSFQYEGMLMRKQTEEHFAAVADLMQKKAGERLTDLVEALRSVARDPEVQKFNLPGILPLLASSTKLRDLPLENLYVFDDQDRMAAPASAPAVIPEAATQVRDLDWGHLRDEIDRLDHLEFVDKNIRAAIEGYAALQSPALAPALQAALLKNIAGGYRKLHESRQAENTYLKLIRNFDQLPDISGVPTGIVADQLLIRLYEEDKAWDRALDVRLDLYEGLVLKRWVLTPARRQSLLSDLLKTLPTALAGSAAGAADRRARWERLDALRRQLDRLETAAQAFEKQEWPDLLRRLRGHGWLEQGGVLEGTSPGLENRIVVAAPILSPPSEHRRGLLVAILPADSVWPLIDQELNELARPVGLEVLWDHSTRDHSSLNKSPPFLLQPVLERTVDRIDPPLHLRFRDMNSQGHNQLFERRRWIYGGMVGLSFIVIIVGLAVMGLSVKREMEVANLKADFVATVSHELRTPLAAISHIGERLSLGRVRSEDERNEFYGLLGKETHRLRGLIEDILDFSKMLAGRKVYRRESVDMGELLQEARDSFEGKAEGLGFEVTMDLPPGKVMILGDPRAILQAVLNLMDNALKYSGESHRIDVRLKTTGGRCLVEVQDYGIGIPESEKERIFEKFYRVENAMSHASESGVGLGLAMVKHIVEGHQGVIRVDSKPGQGSQFTLDFPLAPGGPDGPNPRC